MAHKTYIVLFVLVASVTFANSFSFSQFKNKGSVGGGGDCAACTIVSSLVEQLSEKNEQTVEELLDEICDYFPTVFATTCNYFVNTYGDMLITLFAKGLNPDEVCLSLEFCTNATCGLYRPSENGYATMEKLKPQIMEAKKSITETPWDWILTLINTLANKHEPIVDADSDLFSTVETLRGADWRGRDCDDYDKFIYPGSKIPPSDPSIDSNCNGIYGTDSNGNSYEDLLCAKYQQYGTIVLGDSAGAHFEIPPSYMNASEINKSTYSGLLGLLEDEFDYPQRSAYTAWEGTYDSIYRRMFANNHCNHRDYQNLGVNGCRSGAMADNVILSLARNQTRDHPALVFFELVGNDVCHPEPTLDAMTTPDEFYVNILKSLEYLNSTLPMGSHVVFVGLADGRVLFEQMHNRTHPLGITYVDMYDYLNCLQISPCWVWMNSDEDVRNAGSARAAELNLVYGEIIKNHTFVNFDMVYYDFPFVEISAMWKAQGGQTWELIEPIDGFHPNQIAHELIAEYFWTTLQKEHPEFLGPENPNNQLIEQIFNNQGGY